MARTQSTADVTLVGAGPVGSLLALALAQRGLRVEVFERRHDMRTHNIAAGRSINLAVSTRGLHALAQVGLAREVMAHTVPMHGRETHGQSGERNFLRYGRDDSEFISSMSRGGLNQLLMHEAEKTGKVRIHFRKKLVACDVHKRALLLCDEDTDNAQEVRANVVIGTDGSASVMRAALASKVGAKSSESLLSAGYKELTLPALPRGRHGEFGAWALNPHALHIWPRGRFMLIALANPQGTFTCTLFLQHARSKSGEPSFADLADSASALRFFEQWFPDFVPLVPDLAWQFAEAPLGQMVTVKAWPWCHEAVGLCGDAAHAIVPFFGQGMNAGFEDVSVLLELIDAAPRPLDWPALIAQHAELRKPNTDAIADLAVENFVEMRDRVADPAFLLERAVEAAISARLDGKYRSRYQLVTFTRVPYRAALEAGLIQSDILGRLCAGKSHLREVDLHLAEKLMRERLLPFLARIGVN